MSDSPRDFSFPVMRRRYGAATSFEGIQSRGAAVDSRQMAHVFPADGETTERLQQGDENVRVVSAHAEGDWRVSDGDLPADVLLYDGALFELRECARWLEGPSGSPSWKRFSAILVKRP